MGTAARSGNAVRSNPRRSARRLLGLALGLVVTGATLAGTNPAAGAGAGGGGVMVEATDWRPAVQNTQSLESYAPNDTGGTLVLGLRNAGPTAQISDVRINGATIAELHQARAELWARIQPPTLTTGAGGSITVKLLAPFRSGQSVDVSLRAGDQTVRHRVRLVDGPLRLAYVTATPDGSRLYAYVRNDGTGPLTLRSPLVVDGRSVGGRPLAGSLAPGEVSLFDVPTPPGPLARFMTIRVDYLDGSQLRAAYAHIKVAPAWIPFGGYGQSYREYEAQAAHGMNLVGRGLFSDTGEQAAWNALACERYGLRQFLFDVRDRLADLAAQGTSPCVAAIPNDEPEWNGVFPFTKADDWDAMQAFVDERVAHSNAVGDTKMNYVDNAIGRVISAFAYAADINGNDHYAIDTWSSDGDSSHPLEESGYFSELTRRAGEPRPSWDWPQMTTGISWSDDEAWNRVPTPAELRVQAYTMLRAGTKGLLWFTWSPEMDARYPATTREAARVTREVEMIRELVGTGDAMNRAVKVSADSTGRPSRVQVGQLVGRDRAAILVTNLDYSYQRVVHLTPIPPSPTQPYRFRSHPRVTVQAKLAPWIAAPVVARIDSVTGPELVPVRRIGRRTIELDVTSLETTALLLTLPDRAAYDELVQRWAQVSERITAADADALNSPPPPNNPRFEDGQPKLARVWSVRTRDANVSGVAVHNGVAYVASRDRSLYAIDAASGDRLWTARLGSSSLTTPAVAAGLVLVGTNAGELRALEAASGALRWRVRTGGAVRSAPAVADGVVVFGSDDGRIRAVDVSTGTARWSVTTAGPVVAAPVVVGRRIVVGSSDGIVRALALRDGATRWSFDTGDQVVAPAAAADGVVYVGGFSAQLFAIDAADGSQRWSAALPGSLTTTPLVDGGRVVVGLMPYGDCEVDADPPGFAGFRALAAADGRALWETEMLGCDFGHSAAISAYGSLFAGSALGSLVQLDPATGALQGTYQTRAWIHGAPAAAAGLVLVAGDDQRIRALRPVPVPVPGD